MGKLPLDDPRWCAMQAAIELRQRQTGAIPLAITDLERAMASDKLRSMRRDSSTGAPERLEPSFWIDHLIDVSTGAVAIYRCNEGDKDAPQRWSFYAHRHDQRIDGHVYYVWRPDLEKLYPASGTRADHDDAGDSEEPLQPIARATAVLRDLYLTRAQMPRSLKAATKEVRTECQKRDWQPPSEDTVQRAAEKLATPPRPSSARISFDSSTGTFWSDEGSTATSS
jgi:hypothetical protein